MAALGGANSCLDTDPGRAAAYETALMDLFATCVHGAAHAFALASAESIAPGDLAPFAVGISAVLSEMIPRWAERLRTGRFPGGRSTVASAAATLTRLVQAASAHGLDTGALAAAKRTADRAVAAGHGRDGLARLVAATAATAGVPAPPSRG
ncbi:hypothetical protein C3488_10735 [Streptomyces sp. Ru72]|nr:hypothetical protein C3488_10735 [Streptomyces sp. Ru72]